jgi:phage repressor protein C with HTH and peptisase S24 domain
MERYERIEKAIKNSGKQKSQIAKECGVANSAVSQWISGETKSLKPENLFALENSTGFSARWLAIGEGPERMVSEIEIRERLSPRGSHTPADSDEVYVPVYKEVELSAEAGTTAIQESSGHQIRFAISTLRECGVQPENAVAAHVTGTSMEPRISEGSTIGIDTGMTSIVDGEIYAIDHDDMLRVKFLYRMPGGSVRLRSENSEEHPDEILKPKELGSLKIIGMVFWWSTVRRKRIATLR